MPDTRPTGLVVVGRIIGADPSPDRRFEPEPMIRVHLEDQLHRHAAKGPAHA